MEQPSNKQLWYSPETIDVLKRQMEMSDETWHKIMHPMCGACMAERGRKYTIETYGIGDSESTS